MITITSISTLWRDLPGASSNEEGNGVAVKRHRVKGYSYMRKGKRVHVPGHMVGGAKHHKKKR